ncbi:hypothetical protein D6817_02665 [Candidatus Pacearchaeota archaeon]|nr:MAG: hypothetical protein D6817_02665 [Candidatus Pacearchaeota archaeon]
MQEEYLKNLKKKFVLRRVAWILFIIVLFYELRYGSLKNYFSTTVDTLIIGLLVAGWIFGILKSGKDAEKYVEYQKAGGDKKYPYMKKVLKVKGWINRFLAVTLIAEGILWGALLIFLLIPVVISLYFGITPTFIFNTKFIVSGILLLVTFVFFIWLGMRIWQKSKPMVKGKAPKY